MLRGLVTAGLIGLLWSSFALAQPMRLGGNSGGGGNLGAAEKLNDLELEGYLRSVMPKLARAHFQMVELSSVFATEEPAWTNVTTESGEEIAKGEELYKKAFRGSETIYQKIDSAQIVVQDEPCVDPVSGEFRDAAANVETNTICYSRERLQKLAITQHILSYLLSLAVHEYLHLVGATEEEALLAEEWARVLVTIDGQMFGRTMTRLHDAGQETRALRALKALHKKFDGLSQPQLAGHLAHVGALVEVQIKDTMMTAFMGGLSPFSKQQMLDLVVIMAKARTLLHLADHLLGKQIGGLLDYQTDDDIIAIDFGSRNEVSVREGFKYMNLRLGLREDLKLRRLERFPRRVWKAELGEMIQMFDSARDVRPVMPTGTAP